MLVDKLKLVIAKPILIDDISLYVTARIGIAGYPEHGASLEKLIDIADFSMCTNKKAMR